MAEDFRSGRALGRPEPRDPARRALWEGVSLWTSLAAARQKAMEYPVLGAFVSELAVPVGTPAIRILRTAGRGHVTVWADPELLVDLVVDTVRVRE